MSKRLVGNVTVGKGPKGDPGPQGPQGPVGPTGPMGPAGSSIAFIEMHEALEYGNWFGIAYHPIDFNVPFTDIRGDIDQLKVGDRIIAIGDVNDRPGMKVKVLFEITNQTADNWVFRGRGMSNLIDAHDRTELDKEILDIRHEITHNESEINRVESDSIKRDQALDKRITDAIIGGGGTPGPAGPEGPRGPEGPQGPAGPPGKRGSRGEAGPVGPQGAVGPQGQRGETGIQGPKGNDGATGPMGPTGPQGLDGPTGPVGPAGKNGIDAVYEVKPLKDEWTNNIDEAKDSGIYRTVTTTIGKWPSGFPEVGQPARDAILEVMAQNTDRRFISQRLSIIRGEGSQWQNKIFVRGWDATKWTEWKEGAGPVGPQGPAGQTGAQGQPGPQGPPGKTGPKGDIGLTGPPGTFKTTTVTSDINKLITEGIYRTQSDTVGTFPSGVGNLGSGDRDGIIQVYNQYGTRYFQLWISNNSPFRALFMRTSSNSGTVWSQWTEANNSMNKPKGGYAISADNYAPRGGGYARTNEQTIGLPLADKTYGILCYLSENDGNGSSDNSQAGIQIFYPSNSSSGGRVYTRWRNSSNWAPQWTEIMTKPLADASYAKKDDFNLTKKNGNSMTDGYMRFPNNFIIEWKEVTPGGSSYNWFDIHVDHVKDIFSWYVTPVSPVISPGDHEAPTIKSYLWGTDQGARYIRVWSNKGGYKYRLTVFGHWV